MAGKSESIDKVMAGIKLRRETLVGETRDNIIGLLADARDDEADDAVLRKALATGNSERPLSRTKRVQFATNGAPSTVDDNIEVTPRPYNSDGTGDVTQQPEDDGVLMIDKIAIEFDGDLKLNTLKEMRNNYAVEIHYEGGKRTRIVQLRDIMEAGNVNSIDAGVDNATAGSESVVAGTHKVVSPPRALLRFSPKEMMVVAPGESAAKLKLVLNPYAGGTKPALTGESAKLYFYATFYGSRVASKHERL